MKKDVLALFIGALVSYNTQAQIDFSFWGRSAAGVESNVFNAPDIYIGPQGDTLTTDSLFVSDQLLLIELGTDLKWKVKKHAFSWKTDLSLQRYADVKQANATEVDSWLRYKRKSRRGISRAGYARLRSQDRLGLNVLGSELMTPFSFRQASAGFELSKDLTKWYALSTFFDATFKDYDPCVACGLENETVSLTQREWELGLNQTITLDRNMKRDEKLEVQVIWRDRKYRDWINYKLLDPNQTAFDEDPFLPFDPNANYESRHWRYAIGELSYTKPVNKYVILKPQLEYTRRFDVSNGDFGSQQWQTTLLAYLKSAKWKARLRLGYTRRDYTDRLAKQQEGVPYPNLRYTYLRTGLRIEHHVNSSFSIWADVDRTARESNTSLLTTRVRRSYENYLFMVGITASWDRPRKS